MLINNRPQITISKLSLYATVTLFLESPLSPHDLIPKSFLSLSKLFLKPCDVILNSLSHASVAFELSLCSTCFAVFLDLQCRYHLAWSNSLFMTFVSLLISLHWKVGKLVIGDKHVALCLYKASSVLSPEKQRERKNSTL